MSCCNVFIVTAVSTAAVLPADACRQRGSFDHPSSSLPHHLFQTCPGVCAVPREEEPSGDERPATEATAARLYQGAGQGGVQEPSVSGKTLI